MIWIGEQKYFTNYCTFLYPVAALEDAGSSAWLNLNIVSRSSIIKSYNFSSSFNHLPKSTRKLLLNKKELLKLNKSVNNSGLTIIPLKLYLNEKGIAKLEIALAKGKKLYDKRQTMIDRDNKRDLDRVKKENKS